MKIKSYLRKGNFRTNSHFSPCGNFHLFTIRNYVMTPNGAGIYKDGKSFNVPRDYAAQVLRSWRKA
jgi:hypothetical protein